MSGMRTSPSRETICSAPTQSRNNINGKIETRILHGGNYLYKLLYSYSDTLLIISVYSLKEGRRVTRFVFLPARPGRLVIALLTEKQILSSPHVRRSWRSGNHVTKDRMTTNGVDVYSLHTLLRIPRKYFLNQFGLQNIFCL